VTTAGAQLQFGAEFAVFLVALAGLSFVLLRAELLVDGAAQRFGLAAGLGSLGAAAFLHGSLVVDDPNSAGLVGLRIAGVVLLAIAPFGWHARNGGRLWLWAGVVALALCEAALRTDNTTLGNWLRIAGAIGIGAALLSAGRNSIPTRVAASSAALLLAVVLAVALSLSVVISNNVEREAIRRFSAEAGAESELVENQGATVVSDIELIRSGLNSPAQVQSQEDFDVLANPPDDDARLAAAGDLTRVLNAFVTSFKDIDPRIGSIVVLQTDRKSVV